MTEHEIFETQDGSHSIFSKKYSVSYHSKYGAIQESMHVFIEAGLFPLAIARDRISILEMGLGTGLNAFLTLLEAEKRALKIRYEALEAFPISLTEAGHLNYSSMLDVPDQQELFLRLHESPWDEWNILTSSFQFRKVRQRLEEAQYSEEFNLIYFDAFAPNAQPELWEKPVLERMYKALKPQGVLVTYCAKGIVKRHFKSLGFEVEALKGPPGKREMTRCVKC